MMNLPLGLYTIVLVLGSQLPPLFKGAKLPFIAPAREVKERIKSASGTLIRFLLCEAKVPLESIY